MILLLNEVLSRADAIRLQEELAMPSCATTDAEDRRRTAEASSALLIDALNSHPLFGLGVQPSRISQPLFTCRSSAAEETPRLARVDEDWMQADVVLAVFLSDPESYDGGELVIDTGYGDEAYKQPLGSCVAYPASARSRVATVTRGQRWGADLFVRSQVREEEKREILYNISCAERYLELFRRGTSIEAERLGRCRESLFRLWGER
jgi:PKHD-type hydroxylase